MAFLSSDQLMPSYIANFVLETANAPGIALQVQLAGASPGRQTFAQAFTTGAAVFYFLDDGSQAEWGIGTFTSGNPNVLARTTVIGNTAATTTRLNFSGATNVYSDIPAEKMLYVDTGLIARLPTGALLDPGAGGTPVGAGMDFWGTVAPSGWLFCAGQAISRTQYSQLFAVIGTTYGTGDGSTTYNLPDKRGRVSAALDTNGNSTTAARISTVLTNALGASGGDQNQQAHTHAVTITDPSHAHSVGDPGHVHQYNHPGFVATTGVAVGPNFNLADTGFNDGANFTGIVIAAAVTGITATAASVGAGAAQNVQPTILCGYLIFSGTG